MYLSLFAWSSVSESKNHCQMSVAFSVQKSGQLEPIIIVEDLNRRNWKTNKALSRSNKKMNSSAFVFFIATAEHGRAATLLQSFWKKRLALERKHFVDQIVHDVPMRKLFKSCGSWNSGSFQITSFQVRTCVLCEWCKSMLALTQLQLKRRNRIKNLSLNVRHTLRSNRKNLGYSNAKSSWLTQ